MTSAKNQHLQLKGNNILSSLTLTDLNITNLGFALSAGAVEYTNCISAER